MQLRYTGATPTAFLALGRYLEYGETFDVEDDQAAGYLAREDVEQLPDAKPARRAAKQAAPEETPAPQAPDEQLS